jgi:hypothetical protein
LAVETAATQTKPAYAGSKEFDFSSVHAGELGFYSSEFSLPELNVDTNEHCRTIRKHLYSNRMKITIGIINNHKEKTAP